MELMHVLNRVTCGEETRQSLIEMLCRDAVRLYSNNLVYAGDQLQCVVRRLLGKKHTEVVDGVTDYEVAAQERSMVAFNRLNELGLDPKQAEKLIVSLGNDVRGVWEGYA